MFVHYVIVYLIVFFLIIRRLPRSTLFPYTTLFRSFQALLLLDQADEQVVTLDALVGVEPVRVAFLENRSEEHTSELQSRPHLVCRLLLEKKKESAFGRVLRTLLISCSLALSFHSSN